jgi:hypothetical protein
MSKRKPWCAAFAMLQLAAGRATAQCGPQWLAGSGVPGVNGTVYSAIMWDPDGAGPQAPRLVIVGSFTVAGGAGASNIAMWDGVTWMPLGSGLNDAAYALATLPNGSLVAAGSFTAAGGAPASHIARWNGSGWSGLGAGINGSAGALLSLPNGDLLVGGYFTTAGGAPANSIARWSGSVWSPLGSGISGYGVASLVRMPNGDVIAGGTIFSAGGTTVSGAARWDGSAWSTLGTGLTGGFPMTTVQGLVVLPSGDLLAAGNFTSAGGVFAPYLARWNGTVWSGIGINLTGYQDPGMSAVAVLSNGDVVAAGYMLIPGISSPVSCARLSGGQWSLVDPSGGPDANSFCPLPDGGFYACAGFTSIGALRAYGVARYGAAGWSAAGSGSDGQVNALATLHSGRVVAAGSFTSVAGISANHIASWDGAAWSPLGSGMDRDVQALAVLPSGDLIAGGGFSIAGGVAVNGIARWDGAAWSSLGLAYSSSVRCLAVAPNGDLLAGGYFPGGRYIVRWNGSAWSTLGPGGLPEPWPTALAVLPNGDVIAGGTFQYAAGTTVNGIARWNGSSWFPLGSGMVAPGLSTGYVDALAVLPGGDLIAAGRFIEASSVAANNIAQWNGSVWSPLGEGLLGGPGTYPVLALSVSATGDVIAGGTFAMAGGLTAPSIAKWNGTAWSALGTGINGTVQALAFAPNGELAAGGDFTTAGNVVSSYLARWSDTGRTWIVHQPFPQTVTPGLTLTLTATPAAGYSGVSFQWRRNGVNISNGPGGASPGGGTVVGAAGPMTSPTSGAAVVLNINNMHASDAGQYDVTFSNACGGVTSQSVNVSVGTPCYANCDSSSSSPILNINDFQCFINAFASGDPYANCDGSTAPPILNVNDFQCFLNAFAAGCS